jgi:hypothetical protein
MADFAQEAMDEHSDRFKLGEKDMLLRSRRFLADPGFMCP